MVGSGMLGGCPAAVRVDTASGDTLFLVNRDVMPRLAYGEQLFILAHELGHRLLMTSSETEADAFALGLTAGRQRRSLKSAVRAVASMEAVPVARLRALYNLCLQTDRQQKQQRLMKKQHIFDDDGFFRAAANAAATAAPAAEEPAPAPIADADDARQAEEQALMLGRLLAGGCGLSRRPGIHIGPWFVSAELIGLAAILVCTIVIAARLKNQ